MRTVLITGLVFLGLSGSAQAYDTFIPLGFGYSTTQRNAQTVTAQEQKTIDQADIYETDIYKRQVRAREFDSRNRRFQDDRNWNGTDNWIDY